jgi:hypothetical protein
LLGTSTSRIKGSCREDCGGGSFTREHSERLHKKLIDALERDPPPETREKLLHNEQATLKRWIKREYGSEKVEKLIGKIENGFDYWFTFVTHTGVASTNNRAERAQIAEHVGKR